MDVCVCVCVCARARVRLLGRGTHIDGCFSPFLLLIQTLGNFLFSIFTQEPAHSVRLWRLQRVKMIQYSGAGTEAGWLISLLAERGRGLSGKIVLMTALLHFGECGGGGRGSNRCSN